MRRWAVVDRPVCNEDGNFTGHWSCEEEDPNGPFVLWDDHLAAVEEARRAAFREALKAHKEFGNLLASSNPERVPFKDWLKARAEGRGE